jgi:hypothetical protein
LKLRDATTISLYRPSTCLLVGGATNRNLLLISLVIVLLSGKTVFSTLWSYFYYCDFFMDTQGHGR